MPQFVYQGRDKEGHLHTGKRAAVTVDELNTALIKEGLFPTQIQLYSEKNQFLVILRNKLQNKVLHLEELAIFSRQMQLLHDARVPIITSLKQLATYTRSSLLKDALIGVIEQIEKGQSLADAMKNYPEAFSPLIINIVKIGETTGHLAEAFAHLHRYLTFELTNVKQFKSAFRYPLFVIFSIAFAIVVLNLFVIPTFARFYSHAQMALPWQTALLISVSNFFVNDGIYLLIAMLIGGYFLFRYLRTPQGKYKWHAYQLQIPIVGSMLRRIILVRFCQSLAIIIESGIPVTQGLRLVQKVLQNAYINQQISQMVEGIERGNSFSQAIAKVTLFTPLELQILGVGEKNSSLGPALKYIGDFQHHEIEFDLKRMNDLIGPFMTGAVAILILILALGIYLPIWNMINLVH